MKCWHYTGPQKYFSNYQPASRPSDRCSSQTEGSASNSSCPTFQLCYHILMTRPAKYTSTHTSLRATVVSSAQVATSRPEALTQSSSEGTVASASHSKPSRQRMVCTPRHTQEIGSSPGTHESAPSIRMPPLILLSWKTQRSKWTPNEIAQYKAGFACT